MIPTVSDSKVVLLSAKNINITLEGEKIESQPAKVTFSPNWQNNQFHDKHNQQWGGKTECQSRTKGHGIVFVRQSNRFVIAIKASLVGILGRPVVVVKVW